MTAVAQYFGAIEAGGTKFICAIGDAQGQIRDRIRFDTGDPSATLPQVLLYFQRIEREVGPLLSIGVGAFGPLDLRPTSATFGYITSTPKRAWLNTDLLGTLQRGLGRPMYLDTDVNAAALAELRWGAGQNLQSLAYVTVGTGIGVGLIHHGRPVHGLMHPEAGHLLLRRHPADSQFKGICPFHGDCLEGLASGPAIVARTGRDLSEAATADPIWELETDYLAQLCAQLVLSNSPQRIVLGGGVMQQPRLFEGIHARMLAWLGGYVAAPELREAQYVVAPGLGDTSGIKGALSLAIAAARPFDAEPWTALP